MFETDILSELNFVLEFNLPKEISDNQDHIKLSVNRVEIPAVEIPACPIGHKPISFRTPGEIRCLERYKYIKDILPFINRWVNSVFSPCSKLNSSRSNQFVDAKLYAYKKDCSLFRKWSLVEFYPLFNPNVEYFSGDVVEMIFKFENAIIEEDDKSVMYEISKYIKEYKDRESKCEYCAYHHVHGGRCYICKNHDWFVQEINLKQYIIKRVTEYSAKEFANSKEAVALKEKIDLRKNVYNDFNKYVEKQKEVLNKELQDRHTELSNLESEYNYVKALHIKDSVDKALASLESIEE